jgi:hypothetical protein
VRRPSAADRASATAILQGVAAIALLALAFNSDKVIALVANSDALLPAALIVDMATDTSFYGVVPCPLGTPQRSAGDGQARSSDYPRCDPELRTLANPRGSRIFFARVTLGGWPKRRDQQNMTIRNECCGA